MKPTIGRIIIYRSRTGDYDVPAIVTATTETIDAEAAERGDLPALSSDEHVHLTVFTPGRPIAGPNADDPDAKVEAVVGALNLAGTYQEWDIPFDGDVDDIPADNPDQVAPGTWRWPERV